MCALTNQESDSEHGHAIDTNGSTPMQHKYSLTPKSLSKYKEGHERLSEDEYDDDVRVGLKVVDENDATRHAQHTDHMNETYTTEEDEPVALGDNDGQNSIITEGDDDDQGNNPSIACAVNLSLAVNILLLFSKTAVFVLTFSYAVIASLVDSVLDLLSQFIIWLTERKVRKRDPAKYPVGKTRLEPVGILTVSVLMVMLSVTVIRESIQALITGVHTVEWSVPAVILLAAVIFLKFLLWIYCRRFKHSPIAQALAQDHINDVMSNAVAFIVLFIAAFYPKLAWLDPVGATLMSLYIIWNWYQTGKDEVKKLVGRQADEDTLDELRKVCDAHHPEADLDVLRGYHIGRNLLVEVEMIMAKETTLEITHDVCMDLQVKLERFDYVERAFVHCDYMHRGFDEHKQPVLK